MKLVVLGATGGLGGRLARFFHRQGYDVFAQGRNPTKLGLLKSEGLNCIAAELNDPSLIQAVARFRPDVVINAAGKSGFSRGRAAYAKANIETVESAINLARAADNCRLIHFSSPSVCYRAADCFNITEDQNFTPPVSAYAWSRQQAELLLNKVDDLPITIIRLRSAYGYGVNSPLQSIRQRIFSLKFLPLVRGGNVKIDLIHVDDAIEAIGAVLNSPQKSGQMILNVAGPEALSFRQIAEQIAAFESVRPKWLPMPGYCVTAAGTIAEIAMLGSDQNSEPALSKHLAGSLLYSQTLSLEKIKKAVGWLPVMTLEKAIAGQKI